MLAEVWFATRPAFEGIKTISWYPYCDEPLCSQRDPLLRGLRHFVPAFIISILVFATRPAFEGIKTQHTEFALSL